VHTGTCGKRRRRGRRGTYSRTHLYDDHWGRTLWCNIRIWGRNRRAPGYLQAGLWSAAAPASAALPKADRRAESRGGNSLKRTVDILVNSGWGIPDRGGSESVGLELQRRHRVSLFEAVFHDSPQAALVDMAPEGNVGEDCLYVVERAGVERHVRDALRDDRAAYFP